MMDNNRMIEGTLFEDQSNLTAIGSLNHLERAMLDGTPLEARAVRCVNDCLLFDLGGISGMMPSHLLEYRVEGSPLKKSMPHQMVGRIMRFCVEGFVVWEGKPVAVLNRAVLQQRFYQRELCRWSVGEVITAKVLPSHASHCAFLDIGAGWCARLSNDGFSVGRVDDMKKVTRPGMLLRVVITEITAQGLITVSHRQLLGDFDQNVAALDLRPNSVVLGRISSVQDYGCFVNLAPNLVGLMDHSEATAGLRVGACVAVYVKAVIPEKKKIKLCFVSMTEEFPTCPAQYHYFEPARTVDAPLAQQAA